MNYVDIHKKAELIMCEHFLIKRAIESHGDIFPVSNFEKIEHGFFIETVRGKTYLLLWYNDSKNSTHLQRELIA